MRFFISALAWLLTAWLSLSCAGTLMMVAAVIVRSVDGRYTTGFAVAAGTMSVLIGSLFGVLLRQTIRHLRKPDQKTARDVLGIGVFVLGAFALRHLFRSALPILKENGIATHWQLAAVLLFCVMWLLLYRYVVRSVGDRAFAPRVVESGPH